MGIKKTPIISIKDLKKTFGKTQALNGVSLEVESGTITGFLGPNGAGKSTTMNILLGFIRPDADSGAVKLFGHDVHVDRPWTRRDVGFLAANMALDDTLKVSHELEYYGHLAGHYDPAEVKSLAKRLSLNLDAKVGNLSTGNHQKVALIIALMNSPKLLILDEPTNGLDPLVQKEFNAIIRDLARKGSTIFISSHILSEIDELCDHFIFIKGGEIVGKKSRAQLRKSRGKQFRVNSYDYHKVSALLKKAKIHYQVEDVTDLDDEFMSYYDDQPTAQPKPKKGAANV